ncbi:MAG: peptidoglycan-associated lipoprotein Pal [Lactobacillaceae bacterium]|nr:peptidoglycan-associated lipoprotein Pal [Lactobacillaceae bacterium]
MRKLEVVNKFVNKLNPMEINKMKKILGLFCAIALLAGCSSSDSNGGLFGGSECDSAEARDFIANAGDRVFFAYDSSAISSDAADSLKAQAKWLNNNKNVSIVVQGHADERGTREYNLALGERRANAAKQYLISRGVAADRISTISYGKEKPEVLGSNEAAWAQNRRAVTVIKVN